MQIFKIFEEKKVKLIGVEEPCVYIGKFNLLTNKMTVKLYYKGSLVAKRKRKIENEYDYKLVEFFEDNEADELTEVYNFFGSNNFISNNDKHRIHNIDVTDFSAKEKIEKINVKEKITKKFFEG